MNKCIERKALTHSATNDLIVLSNEIEGAARSAAVVVPRVVALFPWIRSVVDVGCGVGTWLHQFHIHGVERIIGIDSTQYPDALIQIDPTEFQRRDNLEQIYLNERFDLALSLHLGERLAGPSATELVKSLARASDLIIFGAAIPGQNSLSAPHERWPSYWAALFEKQGFVCFDVIRGDIWYDERVDWWYRQNTFVFVNKQRADLLKYLELIAVIHKPPIDFVHPACFESYRVTTDLILLGRIENAAMDPKERTDLAILRERLYAIEKSTSWRFIATIQRLIAPYPHLRKFIRRGVTAIRLMVAGKLISMLREQLSITVRRISNRYR